MQNELFQDGPHQIYQEALIELERAKKKHPRWPTHIAAQAGVVVEEAGELMREALGKKYERKRHPDKTPADWTAALRAEAIQTIASAIRFIENLK